MNELIKKYIELLFSEGNKNKRDIIINLGLLIEKNTDKENPTDYVQGTSNPPLKNQKENHIT